MAHPDKKNDIYGDKKNDIYGESYLWDTSSVVTTEDVDKTLFPATSNASHILPVSTTGEKCC